jgi:hypothetical protein
VANRTERAYALEVTARRPACLLVILLLVLAASAHAVLPAGGSKFKGSTKEELNGFKAPVSFKVAGNQKKLKAFRYGSYACLTDVGPGAGDPFKNFQQKFGSIPLTDAGKFSKTKKITPLPNQTQTVKVKGKFKSATKASGKITISRSDFDCRQSFKFSAKKKG